MNFPPYPASKLLPLSSWLGRHWNRVRVLLDECLPRGLAGLLSGHAVSTVPQMGWSGIRNSVLIERAAGEFDALITVDRLLARERTDRSGLIVVTLEARANRIDALRPLVPQVLLAFDTAEPGATIMIGQ